MTVMNEVTRAMKTHFQGALQAYGVYAGQQFILKCLWETDYRCYRTGGQPFRAAPATTGDKVQVLVRQAERAEFPGEIIKKAMA